MRALVASNYKWKMGHVFVVFSEFPNMIRIFHLEYKSIKKDQMRLECTLDLVTLLVSTKTSQIFKMSLLSFSKLNCHFENSH